MSKRMDLIGKTISGVVAARPADGSPARIWMLQFTDGSHVEFVSPAARRGLERLAGPVRVARPGEAGSPQLALNVA
ncbi:MAG: hypothetical protein GTN84_05350 [Hydrogenophaga sp.]|uniref:hypothetical protein n=1 Tax=Hydrogenophaga sp. TaxID=1904254 RepID=UPI0016BB3E42|nr:hypothetical protein [Hydrogenophaga sp.]NIN59484.1 hypothetical protein [Xanthomonadales bacterium]NIN30707.1 hypothetical protein [Hydrogenophaga sp.]NIN54800.1 hypothetical protein [Hydrogenophaga sp.]NIO13738.1 hypothetical protein [Xanthomonadales bacterium]NIO50836.1 hypothetical protein [Hydrogenophaga sp.]